MNRSAGRAFTLVELITLIALVGVATALLVPAMARTRPNNRAVQCLNNLRQLGTAWGMYADDNGGRLVWNRDGGSVGKTALSQDWVGGWMDYTTASDNTNTALLVDHGRYPSAAYLGPYLKSPAAFKCPADPSTVRMGFQNVPRVRSVSMNNWIGEGNRSWSTGSPYQLYRRIDAIGKPVPSSLWIILDEREESINDGCFFTNPDVAWNLIDFPAAYHNRGAGFAFADGHSEIHHWSDPRTTPLILTVGLNTIYPGDVDILWLQQHASSKP